MYIIKSIIKFLLYLLRLLKLLFPMHQSGSSWLSSYLNMDSFCNNAEWLEIVYWVLASSLLWGLRWWRICLHCRRCGLDPWVGKIPWRRKWLLTPVFLSGESQSSQGRKESNTTEWLNWTELTLRENLNLWPASEQLLLIDRVRGSHLVIPWIDITGLNTHLK